MMSTMKTFYRQNRQQQMEQLRRWSTEIKIPLNFKSNPACDNASHSVDKMEEKVDLATSVDNFEAVNTSQVVKEEKVDQASVMENCEVMDFSQQGWNVKLVTAECDEQLIIKLAVKVTTDDDVQGCAEKVTDITEAAQQLKQLQSKLSVMEDVQEQTISTQAQSILGLEVTMQQLQLTITSQGHKISQLELTKMQLEENARFNMSQSLPMGQDEEALHLHVQGPQQLQLGTQTEYPPPGGVITSLQCSTNASLTPCEPPADVPAKPEDVPQHEDVRGLLPPVGDAQAGLHGRAQNLPSSNLADMQRQQSKKGQGWITHMARRIDQLVKKYACPRDKRRSSNRKGKLPNIVAKEFAAIWRLLLAPAPPPIIVPDPRPVVNWNRLNTNQKRNPPTPVRCSLRSCAQDPDFYSKTKDVHACSRRVDNKPVFDCAAPFGSLYGFWTSKGIVALPDIPVHGYICCQEMGDWIIAAEGG